MDAKARLIRYPALHSEVLTLCGRLDTLGQAEIIADRSELDDIERQINTNLQEMEHLRAMISALTDPQERNILTLRYVDGSNGKPTKWKDVAQKLLGDAAPRHVRMVQRHHDCALDHIEQYNNAQKNGQPV